VLSFDLYSSSGRDKIMVDDGGDGLVGNREELILR